MSYSNRRITLILVLALALSTLTATPALADEVAAQVGRVRPDNLPVTAAADQVAGASAASQAAAGKLFHADLSELLGPCDSVGEIVGIGPDIPSVFSSFRQSAPHWSILTNPNWNAMGTGQAVGSDGMVYLAVVFCHQPGDSTASVAASPESASPVSAKSVSRVKATGGDPSPVARLDEALPAIGARRSEIRARLDGQAESVLPQWYVGKCGTEDRGRILDGAPTESGSCPLAE